MLKIKIALATATASVAFSIQAAPVTFIGADNAVTSVADMLNSQAAAAAFDAAVGATTIVDFESQLPASLAITGGSTTSVSLCGALCGFNTSAGGSFFRELIGGTATFDFATPIDAFGFYITGLQTDIVVGQQLTYTDGSTNEIILTPNSTSGGGAFIGFTDLGMSVISVTYNAQPSFTGDIVAIDDLRFRASSIPEPGTLALLGLAGLAFGATHRRR